MHRRQYLAALTVGVGGGLAGCSGDGEDAAPTASPTPNESPAPTRTPTEAPTEAPDPPSFEVESIDAPDSVPIGEEWGFSLTVANTGDREGTFTSAMSARTSDTDWTQLDGEISLDVPAGETATWESSNASTDYMTTTGYRIEETGDEFEVNVVSAQLDFNSLYTSPDGITMTCFGVSFEDSYEWSSGDFEYTEEPSEGNQFAYVDFHAENESGSPEYAPAKLDISILADDRQYDYEISSEEGGEYEGGEVQAGVTREGWILYEVPEDVGEDDVQVAWSDSYIDGEVAVYWSDDG